MDEALDAEGGNRVKQIDAHLGQTIGKEVGKIADDDGQGDTGPAKHVGKAIDYGGWEDSVKETAMLEKFGKNFGDGEDFIDFGAFVINVWK